MKLYKKAIGRDDGMLYDCFDPAALQDLREAAAADFEMVMVNRRVAVLIDQLVEFTRDGCGVDGGDLQEMLHHAGIIEEYTAKEPCCADCVCQEVDEFPCTCYRDSAEYKAMMMMAAQQEE